ncbi:MAG: MBL fold metallo-hydrolase [Deltaproteobacteria bacterium]|nr:MBL fold metallo-hydrolase [Deltaproteobacteria bacterium]
MNVFNGLHFFPWENPTANNCNTIFIDGHTRILIDPGHDHLFGHVRDGLLDLGLAPADMDLVLITHGHPDHMEGIKSFSGTKAQVAMHSVEWDFVKRLAPHYGNAIGMQDFEPHILLGEGDMKVGDINFQVLHSPGHSPGSVCLYWPEEKVLITGDVVFNQGIGRTDLPGGSGEQLKESIERIAALDVAFLLPGHGDMVSGEDQVRANFKIIKEYWFNFI